MDYHERILATSTSPSRQHRSARALERLRAEQLEEAQRLQRIASTLPPASTFEGQLQRRVREKDDEFEVVWNGKSGRDGASLTSDLFRKAARE